MWIDLGVTEAYHLTNLRFADDVLLLSTTLPQLTQLLADLQEEARNYGLELPRQNSNPNQPQQTPRTRRETRS